MALVKCPECGNDVSDTARTCPHCGYNLRIKNTEQKPRRKKKWLPFVIIGGVLLTILIFGVPLIYLISYLASNA